MKTIRIIALILTIIGALNWGLVALFNLDIIAYLFGERNIVSLILYGLVAVSGLIDIAILLDITD